MRKWSFLGLILAMVGMLALAGCDNGHRITAEEIINKMKATKANTTSAHAVVDAEIDAQGFKGQVTVEAWQKNPANVRLEVKSSTFDEAKGLVIVKNDKDIWVSVPSRNEVYKGGLQQLGIPMSDQVLEAMTGDLQQILDYTDAQLVGEGTVAGKDTYKLTLTPKAPSEGQATIPINGKATLWVEKDRWLPLKVEVDGGMLGRGSVTVSTLETNQDVPDSTFQFVVPNGAKVIDQSTATPTKPQTMTLEQAKASAGFRLLVPTYVPTGATLSEVYKLQQNGVGEMFVLNYNHVPNGFSLAQGKTDVDLAGLVPEGFPKEKITVRGIEGTIITSTGTVSGTFLSWTENGVRINIAGSITRDEALKIAASLQ